MASILIVDDDRNILKVLSGLLGEEGLQTLTAGGVDEAIPLISGKDIDLVITDLKMPGKSGIELLTLSRTLKPALPVLMITAHGDIDTAVDAMKKGAYDFITKPFDEAELLGTVNKALAEHNGNRRLLSEYFESEAPPLPDVIGGSAAIGRVVETVRKIASSDTTVLITGETGVGKELIAKALHSLSGRREQPFIKVNCAAIPEALLESELFGYEKGAFTGATMSKPGRFELADRGTIFLDEVGEIPVHLQAKLLGALQDRSFERVGGVKTIKTDIRIVAATLKDLALSVKEGSFRADLYYRLNVVPLPIPPLRERKEDLPQLINYFLRKFSLKHKKDITGVSQEAMSAFISHDWPGNIRELENALEHMVVLSESDVLGQDCLPAGLKRTGIVPQSSGFRDAVGSVSRSAERQMIADALSKTGGNRTRAAELLGISRRTLQNKIKQYGL